MKFAKRVYWIAQIIGWAIYVFISFAANYLSDKQEISMKSLIIALSFATMGILLTHCMRYVMLRFRWLEMPFLKLAPRMSLLMLCIAFLLVNTEALIGWMFNNRPFDYFIEQYQNSFFYLNMLGAILLLILWNGIYLTYYFFNKSYFQEMDNLRLQSSQNEIELKNLKSQLNPHFLFNSLNSIRALVEIDPELAKKTITKLSNLLRTSLISGKKDTISIKEELALVANYLDLEKVRFEDRLMVDFQIDKTVENTEIPPFIIQILAENAIKHGISREIEGGKVTIEVARDANDLILRVTNTGKLKNELSETGIGIENTKSRLKLMYKSNAHFHIFEKDNTVVSEVIIKHIL